MGKNLYCTKVGCVTMVTEVGHISLMVLAYILGLVVGTAIAAAQHDVGIGIAARVNDRHLATAVHAEEAMRTASRLERMNRGIQRAVGAVLESHHR